MIGSTRHPYTFANKDKKKHLDAFVKEYNRVCLFCVDYFWNNLGPELRLSPFTCYNKIPLETDLGRRSFQCAVNQASGIIRSAIEKQRRILWVREHKNPNVKDKVFKKPNISRVDPQLNINCVDFKFSDEKYFKGFLRLTSLGKNYGFIKLPINNTSQIRKWKDDRGAKLCGSLKLCKEQFQLAWKWERSPHAQGDKVIGLDQGLKTVYTLSDGQSTPETCPHGHSLESIAKKLTRKKKGSRGFRKAQTHRKNFVHYSVNKLNFTDVKEVRLEKIVNIRFKRKSSRLMSHWSNPEIRDKIKRRCEELEVPVVEQSCAYRSQRCSSCGQVRKANRKGKTYCCKNCGFIADSDFNAALNHEQDLFPLPVALLVQKQNRGSGFFWKQDGLFSFDGSEFIVQNS